MEFLRKCWRCAGEGSKPSPAGVGEIGLHLAMARAYALLEQPHSDRRAWRVWEGGERGGGKELAEPRCQLQATMPGGNSGEPAAVRANGR